MHHRDEAARSAPSRATPNSAVAPAPLEHRDDHAVGGADRQQVHDRGLERHEDRAEHDHQQQERQHDHRADEPRQPGWRSCREMSMNVAVCAADVDLDAGAGGRRAGSRRRGGGGRACVVASSCGAVRRDRRWMTAASPAALTTGGADGGDVGVGGERVAERRRARGVPTPVARSTDEHQRAVEAGAEARRRARS